jgi:hypothetical protein
LLHAFYWTSKSSSRVFRYVWCCVNWTSFSMSPLYLGVGNRVNGPEWGQFYTIWPVLSNMGLYHIVCGQEAVFVVSRSRIVVSTLLGPALVELCRLRGGRTLGRIGAS